MMNTFYAVCMIALLSLMGCTHASLPTSPDAEATLRRLVANAQSIVIEVERLDSEHVDVPDAFSISLDARADLQQLSNSLRVVSRPRWFPQGESVAALPVALLQVTSHDGTVVSLTLVGYTELIMNSSWIVEIDNSLFDMIVQHYRRTRVPAM